MRSRSQPRALCVENPHRRSRTCPRQKASGSRTAAETATGLIEGNPIYDAIMQRRPGALAEIEAALAGKVAAELGNYPVRCPLRALVFSARRP